MTSQKYMGRGQLVKRLSAQVGSRSLAENILRKRGQLDSKGKLTSSGRKRDSMTAEERAKDRAVKSGGGRPSDYVYNPRKNSTRRK